MLCIIIIVDAAVSHAVLNFHSSSKVYDIRINSHLAYFTCPRYAYFTCFWERIIQSINLGLSSDGKTIGLQWNLTFCIPHFSTTLFAPHFCNPHFLHASLIAYLTYCIPHLLHTSRIAYMTFCKSFPKGVKLKGHTQTHSFIPKFCDQISSWCQIGNLNTESYF